MTDDGDEIPGCIACSQELEGDWEPPAGSLRTVYATFEQPQTPPPDSSPYRFYCEQDEIFDEIFDLLPSFWEAEPFQTFACTLTREERIELLEDVEESLDEIWAMSEEELQVQLDLLQEDTEETLQRLGEGGRGAERFYKNITLYILWQQEYVAE